MIRVPDELAEKLPTIAGRVRDVLVYGDMFGKNAAERLMPIVKQATVLAGKYDAVVTNPPYMGGKGMNPKLKAFARDQFPDSKSDLFAMFIERNIDFALQQGTVGMITMQSWMFLSSFEKLRDRLLDGNTIFSMAHLGARAFDSIGGEVVSTTAFVLKNAHYPEYKGAYIRLIDGNSEAEKDNSLHDAIRNPEFGWFYSASAVDFKKIPGSPIAYWVSERIFRIFDKFPSLSETFFSDGANKTGDNDNYLRFFWEVHQEQIQSFENRTAKWLFCAKGGEFRRWYGNIIHLINWASEAQNHYSKDKVARLLNKKYWYKKGITWSRITSSENIGFRLLPETATFETAGTSVFPIKEDADIINILSLLSSKVAKRIFRILKFLSDNSKSKVRQLGENLISISKSDWDAYETSWDFTILPLIGPDHHKPSLQVTYTVLRAHWRDMILEMQRLEEENNRIFIEAYGLQDELTPDVPLEEISLTCNPRYRYGGNKSEEELEELLLTDTMKELISYAIGCMMGRYSMDAPGLIYANSGNDQFREIYCQKHGKQVPAPDQSDPNYPWASFPPDEDGIIPITDTDWFEDDAANRIAEFISVAWPKEHLEENLKFVADSLGPKKGESARDTIRRYLTTGFYKHHMKMYKKRPIYWLFTSGKQRAFQCLVYLHRYNEATLSRMRTEYVIPLQGKINARIDQLKEDAAAATSTPHRKKVERERDKLLRQQAELQAFDEKLRHYADQRISLDLDDGVKVNYGKLGDLLAEMQVVTGKKKK